MGTIEITTTQNVTIEYELATVRDRILAFTIDLIIIWTSIFLLIIASQVALPNELHAYIPYLVIIPIFLFYSLVSEIFGNGRSWGKKALGLKVVKINGTEGEVSDYLIRWTFRMVDIYFSLGSVASLLISSTGKAQRLGDLVANTTVIKIKPASNLKLNDIMKINSLQNYVPRYPEVRQMNDSEMLVVKNVLERWKKYPNDAHRQAVKELVNVLCTRLNITEQIREPVTFLRTLLNDYIVLTR
jgi:uncharacterized RDD family membrane protein YckC